MQVDEQGLAETYRGCSDDELAALAAEMEALTDAARAALRAEIQPRGMNSAQLGKMHAKELHREMRFDQKERVRRQTLIYILTRSKVWKRGVKDWIWAVSIVLGFLLAKWLWLRFR